MLNLLSMTLLIKVCVGQSRPMKTAVTISRDTVEGVVRALKSHLSGDLVIFPLQASSPFGDAAVLGIAGTIGSI